MEDWIRRAGAANGSPGGGSAGGRGCTTGIWTVSPATGAGTPWEAAGEAGAAETGYGVADAGWAETGLVCIAHGTCGSPDTGCGIPETGCGTPETDCGIPETCWGGAETGGAAAGAGSYSTPSARKSFSAPGPTSEEYATQGEAAEKSAYV